MTESLCRTFKMFYAGYSNKINPCEPRRLAILSWKRERLAKPKNFRGLERHYSPARSNARHPTLSSQGKQRIIKIKTVYSG